jgi:hypothetical protein
MLRSILALQQGVPLWKQILTDIPHDAAAFVAYVLIAAFGVMIWLGSRKRPE